MSSAAVTQPVPAVEPDPARRDAAMRAMVRSLTADIGAPAAVYYVAHVLGASDYAALLAGAVFCAGRTAWVAIRDRRLDVFAGFLLVLFTAGLALTFVTGDARFVLVKTLATSVLAGLLFLASCLVHRPLTYYAAQRFAGPEGAARLRAMTEADPALRSRWYVLSAGWGAGLLAEASIRVPLLYLLPVSVAVGASTAVMVTAFAGLMFWTIRDFKRAARS
ncbi:MAG: hypothetical protein J2P19_02730 [Pseudonocardia sp.]|nr:hypothetical protein [Pseudonocardia sp.]